MIHQITRASQVLYGDCGLAAIVGLTGDHPDNVLKILRKNNFMSFTMWRPGISFNDLQYYFETRKMEISFTPFVEGCPIGKLKSLAKKTKSPTIYVIDTTRKDIYHAIVVEKGNVADNNLTLPRPLDEYMMKAVWNEIPPDPLVYGSIKLVQPKMSLWAKLFS